MGIPCQTWHSHISPTRRGHSRWMQWKDVPNWRISVLRAPPLSQRSGKASGTGSWKSPAPHLKIPGIHLNSRRIRSAFSSIAMISKGDMNAVGMGLSRRNIFWMENCSRISVLNGWEEEIPAIIVMRDSDTPSFCMSLHDVLTVHDKMSYWWRWNVIWLNWSRPVLRAALFISVQASAGKYW